MEEHGGGALSPVLTTSGGTPRRTRLESLLQVILAEQQQQAAAIERLQTGIDELNSRLAGSAAPTSPRHTPAERAAPRESHSTTTANAASALLTRLANETSMLNALTEVLSRHHMEAQQRLAAATARLHVAETSAAMALPPVPTEPADVLAIEYPSDLLAHYGVAPPAAVESAAAVVVARSRSPSSSPRDRTPAAAGALVVRSAAGAQLASRMATGSLRDLLDFALTDSDFSNVLALLATVGGNTGAPPASAAAIDAVPEIQFSDEDHSASSCPICLTDLGCGMVKALPCGDRVQHAFHAQCINAWLRLHNSCPTCRASLAEPGAV